MFWGQQVHYVQLCSSFIQAPWRERTQLMFPLICAPVTSPHPHTHFVLCFEIMVKGSTSLVTATVGDGDLPRTEAGLGLCKSLRASSIQTCKWVHANTIVWLWYFCFVPVVSLTLISMKLGESHTPQAGRTARGIALQWTGNTCVAIKA